MNMLHILPADVLQWQLLLKMMFLVAKSANQEDKYHWTEKIRHTYIVDDKYSTVKK